MTLGQFFLGLVTIFVATVVYRWQKTIDRETALLLEQRKLLSEYSALLKCLYFSQPYRDEAHSDEALTAFFGISGDEQKCYTLRDQIFMTCDDDVVSATEKVDHAFRQWKVAFPKPHEFGEEAATQDAQRQEVKRLSETFLAAHRQFLIAVRNNLKRHGAASLFQNARNVFGR